MNLYMPLALLLSNGIACASTRDVLSQAKDMLKSGQRSNAVKLLSNSKVKEYESKRQIFAEQFITAENFQHFQDMKAFSDSELWSDCLKGLGQITTEDQDNVQVLRVKAFCQLKAGMLDEASKSMFEVLQFEPADFGSIMGLALVSLERKQYAEGLKLLEPISKIVSKKKGESERYAILKSRLLDEQGKVEEAIRVLAVDQELNADHNEVIYRLADLYRRVPGREIQAKRAYILFVSRCKRLSESELNYLRLSHLLLEAKKNIDVLERQFEEKRTGSSGG